jgi:hypothetical protein
VNVYGLVAIIAIPLGAAAIALCIVAIHSHATVIQWGGQPQPPARRRRPARRRLAEDLAVCPECKGAQTDPRWASGGRATRVRVHARAVDCAFCGGRGQVPVARTKPPVV